MGALIDVLFKALESGLWRGIAVAIFAAGLMGLAMGLYLGAVFWKSGTSERKERRALKKKVEFRSARGTLRKQGLRPLQLRHPQFTHH